MSQSTTVVVPSDIRAADALIGQAADALTAGGLVVIPTDTGYAVVADAFNGSAVAALRAARGQDADVPLPVGVGSLETAHGVAVLDGLALDLVTQLWPGSLTLLTAAQPSLSWRIGPSDAALAIRVPAHTVALRVLGRTGPVVMTAAARVGAAPATTVASAVEALGDAVRLYVDAGQVPSIPSSVVDATGDHLRLVREGALTLADIRQIAPMVVKAAS